MASLMSEIKNYLRGQRIELEKLVDEKLKLEDQLKDERLKPEYKQNVLYPKIGDLRFKISQRKNDIQLMVKKMTDGAKQQISALNDIRGEDLTDDAKLFSCGVKLSENDLEKIIDRNNGNATMIQLALRYADQNGMKLKRVLDTHSRELTACDDLYGTAKLYIDHWIDNPDQGTTILDRFFDEGVS